MGHLKKMFVCSIRRVWRKGYLWLRDFITSPKKHCMQLQPFRVLFNADKQLEG